ncbi:HET-domain-containing protein [Lindgomyces ingoldianus]|uniref:HET-domain-containing protein n=1 Tax=Lindgomyces ingoldianus TaxID=673940 RepID=A0ACB6QUP3_9PLEO|nr:HET-domain-containing protein [Lindgomyces ingoldianus]KAF2470656.1 HET-domain-containing protein [Lindgomyces ingoldianus]
MPSASRDSENASDVVPLDWSWAVDDEGNIQLCFHHSPRKRLVPGTYRSSYRPSPRKRQTDIPPPVFRYSALQPTNNAYPPSPPKTPEQGHHVYPLPRRFTAPAQKSKIAYEFDHTTKCKSIDFKGPGTAFSDLDIIKSWLRECNLNHDCSSQGLKTISDYWPMWLIDVEDDCIVQASKSERYVTLSYVCGQVRSLQLMKDNLRLLQRPGVLREQNCVFVIPRTIRQAMNFARLIGERYLWVDQLCMVQDNDATKHPQINNIASIFANSIVTFAAAGGNSADWGLHESGNITLKSNRKPRVPRHDTDHRVQDIHHDLLERSEWNKRGWTLQELVFSKRVIFFFNGRITWQCHSTIWEDSYPVQTTSAQPNQEIFFPQTQKFRYCSLPDLGEYHQLVKEYNKRNLTSTSDTVPAFAGITSALSTTFQGGFLYGLPAQFFDLTLLWQPLCLLKRRKVDLDSGNGDVLPSWSWMGWKGHLDLNFWAGLYDYVREKEGSGRGVWRWPKTSLKIRPIVRWHFVDDKNTKVPISSTAYKFRSLINDRYSELPDGWHRQERSSSGEKYECHYYHSSDPDTTFNYPVPMADTPINASPTLQPRYIACETYRAFFKMGERCWAPHKCLSIEILDQKGAWAGALRLNHRRRDIVPELKSNTRWELIAISKGVAENSRSEAAVLEEWNHPNRPRNGRLYKFYSVMWIEWKGKVAYRKAVGRVLKSAWDAAEKELIEVVLG